MPYIPQWTRADVITGYHPATSGELNYCITLLIHNYVEKKGLSYSSINEVMGVLKCCGDEFYRQVAAPYEDRKKTEYGNISELDK